MPLRTSWMLLVALALPAHLLADEPRDPFRFVPRQAEVVVRVERPRALLDTVLADPLVQEAYRLTGVREAYDSTNFRRLYQLLAHVEKVLGTDRYDLLDAVAGEGIVVAGRFSTPGALLIVQSRDPVLLERFVGLAFDLAEKEIARQEGKVRIERKKVDGIDTFRFDKFKGALVDGALLISSDDAVLRKAIDVKSGDRLAGSKEFREARQGVPATARAWAWLDLEAVRKLPGFKTGFEAGTQDPNVTFLFGGLVDLVKRAPHVTAYMAQEGTNWHLAIGMPRGREGMGGVAKMLVPEGEAASLPLLTPPGTLASSSYYLDLGAMWRHRRDIFNSKQADAMDKAEKDLASGPLLGTKLGKLFEQMGNHHRVVVATQRKPPYTKRPPAQVPAFALVVDMRDPNFGKAANLFLRGYGLVGVVASKGTVKMSEQEHAGQKLLCFRFPEDKPFAGDTNGIRFAFDPCFAVVDDQAIFSSTSELARDLVDELKKTTGPAQPATWRTQLLAHGGAEAIRANEDQALTQMILNSALPPGAARDELRRVIDLVEKLGSLRFEINYGSRDFHYDVIWQRK